jgi:cell wall-associated NlpC family hydrolase
MPPQSTVFRRSRVVSCASVVALLTSILGAGTGLGAAPASADPIADKRAQVAVLARTIDAQGRQIQVLAEQYNGARYHADQVKQELSTAQQSLGTAQSDVARARAELGRQAVEAYIHGGYLAPPPTAPTAGSVDLVVQQQYFGLATNGEADALDRMRTAARRLTEQRTVLDAAQKNAHDAVVALAGRQQAIEQATAADKATLSKVQGELAQLVAQEQARLEAQRIAQEKAALAAQLAKQQAEAAAAAQARQVAAAAATAAASSGRSGLQPVAQRPPVSGGGGGGSVGPPIPAGSSKGLIALAFARSQLGKPYVWAASGPDSYDCSGLTMRAWQAAGVSLPHFAAAQYAMIAHVPIANLQPGDLVFFGSDLHHVGIYAGGGQMINAPYTGTVVRYDSIYGGDLVGGGRPG